MKLLSMLVEIKTSSLVLDEIKKLEVLEMLSGLFLWEMVNLMGKMQLQL